MNSLEYLTKQLEALSDFNIKGNAVLFERKLEKVAELRDPRCILLLLKFFDDETYSTDQMYSIIHLIESFELEIYILELLKGLEALWRKSPDWTVVLHYRILNSEEAMDEYTKQARQLEKDKKEVVKNVLYNVSRENAKFEERCLKVVSNLKA